jgi:hypothetical protein
MKWRIILTGKAVGSMGTVAGRLPTDKIVVACRSQ